MELTTRQREWLRVVLDLYDGEWVTAEEIAEELNRSTGAIRNGITALTDIGLIDSKRGNKGGYAPTEAAYKALGRERLAAATPVPVCHEGEHRSDLTVEGIKLPIVHHPEKCCAEIDFHGSLADIHAGDRLSIGPLPGSKLQIEGDVVGHAGADDILILKTDYIIAPASDPQSQNDRPKPSEIQSSSDD